MLRSIPIRLSRSQREGQIFYHEQSLVVPSFGYLQLMQMDDTDFFIIPQHGRAPDHLRPLHLDSLQRTVYFNPT